MRQITNAAGVPDQRRFYLPYGAVSLSTVAVTNPAPDTKGWIGERFDADAGLQYLNARYYDPQLGMFLQPDWWEVIQAGVGTNRYSYSFGDPVNGIDPSGHAWVDRTWDRVFGGGSFNKTFGERGGAWSDKTFGNKLEKHTGASYLAQPLAQSYADAKRAWSTNGQAVDGSGLVVEAGSYASLGYGAARGAIWLSKAAGNYALSRLGSSSLFGGLNERVFWSGGRSYAGAAAETYAKASGGVTLEMTAAGKLLENVVPKLGQNAVTDVIWRTASRAFASGVMEGATVSVFQASSIRIGAYFKDEYPIMMSKGVNFVFNILE